MGRGTTLDVRGLCTLAALVLCGAAAVLILVILSGGSSDVASKSLSFAFFFALFTLPAAAGAYLARERPGLLWIGALTALGAIAAFIAVISAIWQGNIFESGADFKTPAVLTLISVALGQVSLILGLGRPDDSPLVSKLRWAGLIPIAALTIIGSEDISNHGPAASAKTYGVLGVLYVLAIALPPLVERATRIEEEPAPPHPGTGYH
jgi:hypothetical protein